MQDMQESKDKKSKSSFLLFLIIFIPLAVYLFMTSKKPASSIPEPEQITAAQNTENVETEFINETIGEPQKEVRVVVNGSNFKFEPKTINAKVGEKVIVEFNNIEGVHDFRIEEFGIATRILKANESETVEFTADKTGSFEFYCSVGEHRKMGMVGTLVVEE
ncbi:MAG: hypothetical protein KatS3mg101_0676 [Patescibacteria group bacterium]|nr:MAG: hypothetical protein KatS3mg101_0676 [Patescibacteria group bacterium]